jgi:uncharacterized protein
MNFFPTDSRADYQLPTPRLTATNRPFWEAAREHRLLLQRCSCGEWIYPIAPICAACGAVDDYEWAAASGRARLSSWVVYHHAFEPFTDADLPYAVAEVELEEGMRMITQLVGIEVGDYAAGIELEVAFRDVTPEFTAVLFAPAAEEGSA